MFFDVNDRRFVPIHELVKEGFDVINHGFCDEGKVVEDVEDDVPEGALL